MHCRDGARPVSTLTLPLVAQERRSVNSPVMGCITKCRKIITFAIQYYINIHYKQDHILQDMKTKEEFLIAMGDLWEKLQTIEHASVDLYEFEERFERAINDFGHETIQDIIGSDKRDRRVKKNSTPDME
jgi:uncharacterized membrane-anchored protein YjiN (DUF445 family)